MTFMFPATLTGRTATSKWGGRFFPAFCTFAILQKDDFIV
jgi:hypothetical protein